MGRPQPSSNVLPSPAGVAYLEPSDPGLALGQYKLLARSNIRSYPLIFGVASCSPVVAMLLAYFITPSLPFNQATSTAFIVVTIGYLPPVTLYSMRKSKSLRRFNKTSRWSLGKTSVVLSVALLFERILFWLAVAFAGLLISIPIFLLAGILSWVVTGTFLIADTPQGTALSVLVLAVTLALAFSDTHPKALLHPMNALREIGAGIRVNARSIMISIATFVLGLVIVGAGPLGLLFDRLEFALIMAAVYGVVLGLAIYQIEEDMELSSLIGLGCARCEVRLGRFGSAFHRLGRLHDQVTQFLENDLGTILISCIGNTAERSTSGFSIRMRAYNPPPASQAWELQLFDQTERMVPASSYACEWEASIAATRRLVDDIGPDSRGRR